MSKLKAKFKVFEVAELKGPNGEVLSQRIKLHAVYGSTEENKRWAKATPAGSLELTIDNSSAFNTFKYGDEVYLDFDIAEISPLDRPSTVGGAV